MIPTMLYIPGFDNNYSISIEGRVFSHLTNKFRKQTYDKRGYPQVCLRLDGRNRTFSIHRLMSLTWMSKRDKDYTVDHDDENKNNNWLGNLQYLTPKENFEKSNVGRKRSEETKLRMRKAKQGTTCSPETKTKISKKMTGLNNSRADLTIHKFTHINGEEFEGTRFDFYTTFNLNKNSVGLLIKGKRKTVGGWCYAQ